MNALITGITGQDGAYLAKFLLKKGYDVYGTYRRLSTPNFWRLHYLDIFDKVKIIPAEMLDSRSISDALIEKAVAAGKSEAQINDAMASL